LPIPSLDDPQAQARLKDAVLKRVEDTVKTMFVNPGPPHHIASAVYPSANLADLLLGTGALTDEERARLKARLAYMAYLLNWRSYWAPEKGYGSTPNMSSFAYDAVGLIGLLLADHPESPRWIRACTRQIDRELASWASEDGAWIEAPHYVRAAWQEHTMLMLALKQAGARDYFRNPKVRRFFEYYFTLQTPPDPDGNRQRGVPCIGRS
jgi:hypothetical protein